MPRVGGNILHSISGALKLLATALKTSGRWSLGVVKGCPPKKGSLELLWDWPNQSSSDVCKSWRCVKLDPWIHEWSDSSQVMISMHWLTTPSLQPPIKPRLSCLGSYVGIVVTLNFGYYIILVAVKMFQTKRIITTFDSYTYYKCVYIYIYLYLDLFIYLLIYNDQCGKSTNKPQLWWFRSFLVRS